VKKVFGISLLVCMSSFNLFGVPTSAEQLRSELEAAVKSKDTNAIIALFDCTGVVGDMKEMLAEMPAYLIKDDMAAVNLLPVPAEFQPTNELDGVRYFPNLPVIGLIDIQSVKKGDSWQLPYGKSTNHFYLTGTTQVTFDPNAKKEPMLNIMFTGLMPKDTLINGAYTYVKAGKEIAEKVSFTNSMSYSFHGDYVQSCSFSKSSSGGSISLTIIENTNKIFKSGMIETNNSITYERKK
jgi:hypothetical protein